MDIVDDGDGAEIDLAIDDLIDERYSASIWAWQSARGCTTMDLTPAQLERFNAWRAGGCDKSQACYLVAARRKYAEARS